MSLSITHIFIRLGYYKCCKTLFYTLLNALTCCKILSLNLNFFIYDFIYTDSFSPYYLPSGDPYSFLSYIWLTIDHIKFAFYLITGIRTSLFQNGIPSPILHFFFSYGSRNMCYIVTWNCYSLFFAKSLSMITYFSYLLKILCILISYIFFFIFLRNKKNRGMYLFTKLAYCW